MANQNHKKKVLIIQGNPDGSSFCDALAAAYKKGTVTKLLKGLASGIDGKHNR